MDDKEISKAVVRRMPRYYRYLEELKSRGVERISSSELSDMMHVTASQIRQDLNNFGGFGQQGYGYNVDFLYDEIGKILGISSIHTMILVGVGNLGHAITNYIKFSAKNFKIIGLFDVNPALIGQTVSGEKIQHYDEIPIFLETHNVDIAILTIPKDDAQKVCDDIVKCGVKAFWNFTHIDLNVPKDVVVENVHLFDSLMLLSYHREEVLRESGNGS